MIASANGFRDTQATELTQLSANIALLDRTLVEYGPETKQARSALREKLTFVLEKLSSKEYFRSHGDLGTGVLYDEVQQLSPKDDMQRQLKNQALTIARSVAKLRWLVYEQRTHSVSSIVLAVLVSWLMIIFASFGLFAPTNGTVLTSLFFSALAVSGAVLLLLEMYKPYTGLIPVSTEPLRAALASLGQ